MSGDPLGPTLESNRAALVLIGYSYLEPRLSMYYTGFSVGLVVGPRAIIDFDPWYLENEILQSITVRSVLGSWPSINASIVAHSFGRTSVALLMTEEDLPELPVVLGEINPNITTDGYRFELKEVKSPLQTKIQSRELIYMPVSATVQSDKQQCEVSDSTIASGVMDLDWQVFDMNNRLICFGFLTSQKLERFLLDNGVPVAMK